VKCSFLFDVHDAWRIRGYGKWASYQALPPSLSAPNDYSKAIQDQKSNQTIAKALK
jgi:hypothetical protein